MSLHLGLMHFGGTAKTLNHVIPLALGGGDEPENLITACADCNAGKSSSNPDAPIEGA